MNVNSPAFRRYYISDLNVDLGPAKYVRGPHSIARAIAEASAGDVIHLAPDAWALRDTIVIDKPVVLVGSVSTKLYATFIEDKPAITVEVDDGDYVVINGLSIIFENQVDDYAIDCDGGRCVVRGCYLNSYGGIRVSRGDDGVVADNIISYSAGLRAGAITLESEDDCFIAGNRVAASNTAIDLNSSSYRCAIVGNIVETGGTLGTIQYYAANSCADAGNVATVVTI